MDGLLPFVCSSAAAATAAAVFVCGIAGMGQAAATQKPPAERTNLDPSARNKVGNALVRARLEEDSSRSQADRAAGMGGAGGGKNCSTNIGSGSGQPPAIGQRYGAGGKGDQVVVVKGPVVNLCK